MDGRRSRRFAVVALLALAGSASAARAAPSVSSNWAGYAVTRAGSFTGVSGSWVVPRPVCTSGPSFAAFWVGLGGFDSDARALEQIGTETDCSAAGAPRAYAWYELLPAAPVRLALEIAAGDTVSAAVKVRGTKVSLLIRDVTRRTAASRELRMDSPDLSSAEWIVEAPSACGPYGGCRPLPLTNFGTVSFSNASATAKGHAGAISDPAWSASAVQLGGADPEATYYGLRRWRWLGERSLSSSTAVPTGLSRHGSSFTVTFGPPPARRSKPSRGYSA